LNSSVLFQLSFLLLISFAQKAFTFIGNEMLVFHVGPAAVLTANSAVICPSMLSNTSPLFPKRKSRIGPG